MRAVLAVGRGSCDVNFGGKLVLFPALFSSTLRSCVKGKKKKRSTSKSMCDDEPAAHSGFDPPDLTAEAYRTVPPLCDVSWPIKLSHTHAPPAPAHNNTEHLTRFVSACTNPGGVNQQRDI